MSHRLEVIRKVAKLDARDSAFIDQQLEAMEAEVYRVEYPALKARQFIPLKGDVPAGAETFAYRVWDVFGQADWASNYAGDMPTQTIRGDKVVGKVEGIQDAYGYSSQDMRAAAMTGLPLDAELAKAAMERIEFKVDHTAALGDSTKGFVGFARHPSVGIATATAAFTSATGDQMLADLHALANKIVEDTKELYAPDAILMDTVSFNKIATKLLNTANSNGQTVLAAFLATSPYIKSVQSWTKLGTASDAGGKRAICYKRDPRVLQLVIPMEPLQHEPQRRGLNYVVPIESRFGGMIVRQPLAIRYLDGL